jgi:hypothetical protein
MQKFLFFVLLNFKKLKSPDNDSLQKKKKEKKKGNLNLEGFLKHDT